LVALTQHDQRAHGNEPQLHRAQLSIAATGSAGGM